jgi:glycosyltransferase involved in cell wall biosynthesis
MNTLPLVSVVMPVYNTARFLPDAIESVLSQTYSNFEFIIIDDASTDGSWEIIQAYMNRDRRIRSYRNNQNRHIVYSRNSGIQQSEGDYVAFLDSDDIALPNRVERQVAYMIATPRCGVCGSNFMIIDPFGNTLGTKKFPEKDEDIRNSFFYFNPFAQNTVLIRKRCFDRVGLYNDAFRNAEDLDMWIRIGAEFELHNLQEFLVKYRIHENNSILKSQKTMIKSTLAIRRNAVDRFGYKMGPKAHIAYTLTKGMLYLPSGLVLRLFNSIRKIFI